MPLLKTIDLTDFSASDQFDVGTMLRDFELNAKNSAFAKQKIAQMRRVFFEDLSPSSRFSMV